jgi:hypothetical protein
VDVSVGIIFIPQPMPKQSRFDEKFSSSSDDIEIVFD